MGDPCGLGGGLWKVEWLVIKEGWGAAGTSRAWSARRPGAGTMEDSVHRESFAVPWDSKASEKPQSDGGGRGGRG